MKELTFKSFLIVLLALFVTSCGSRRGVITSKDKQESVAANDPGYDRTPTANTESKQVSRIIKKANSFMGTRYKYGGNSKKGIDCSGLIQTAFLEGDVELPRRSRDMSYRGIRLKLKEVEPGDLLFFHTSKNSKVINHVGLVVDVDKAGIHFIHASTSRGVMVSSLSENYWYKNFVMARRVI